MKKLFIAFFILFLISCQSDMQKSNELAGNDSFIVKESPASLKIGESILFCFRKTKSDNPFLITEKFTCNGNLIATKAPYPGGAVTGKQISSQIEKIKGSDKIIVSRARSIKVGKNALDPKLSASSIEINNSDSEYFENYVLSDNLGKKGIFLDIQIK